MLFDDGRVVGISGRSQGGDVVTERAGSSSAPTAALQSGEAVRPERYHERPPLLAAYYSYWSGLPLTGVSRPISVTPWIRGGPDPRWPDAHRRGWPHVGVRGEQAGRGRQFLEDAGARAGVCRTDVRRETRSAFCRREPAELFPQAIRPRVGARRRRRLPQGPRSRRRGSTTPFATPSTALPHWTRCSRALDRLTM